MHEQSEHQLLVELLEDGNARGEFEISDINDAAIATAIFNTPLLISLYSLEIFHQRAKNVVRLVLNGLMSKQSNTKTAPTNTGGHGKRSDDR